MKKVLDCFNSKIKNIKSQRFRGLDLANLPLIDRDDFSNLSEKGFFGKYEKLASELNISGFTKLKISDSKWLNILDKVNNDINTLVETNDLTLNNRFQDAWLSYGLDSVRQIACHPEILTALKVIFGREAFPFQTLNFIKGSSQALHSDAVHFHSQPHGFMCGLWVALEDVSENSGPLFYYPGSHRLPYLSSLSLGLKLEQIISSEHPQLFFEERWINYINEFGLKRHRFIPSKGEVFIWHSNLLHGGMYINDQELTRRSQVTHYYFRKCAYKRPFCDCINNKEIWFLPNDLLQINS